MKTRKNHTKIMLWHPMHVLWYPSILFFLIKTRIFSYISLVNFFLMGEHVLVSPPRVLPPPFSNKTQQHTKYNKMAILVFSNFLEVKIQFKNHRNNSTKIKYI